MKTLSALLLLIAVGAAEPALPVISLVPQPEMGKRAVVICKDIVWQADSEWFFKPASVCRVSNKPMDVSKIHEQAKLAGMSPKWSEQIEAQYGPKSEGAFYYLGPEEPQFVKVASGSPKRHRFHFCIAPYDHFERDADENAIVKPLPSKEQAVAISREWMKKLGVDENLLYRHGNGPEGFDVVFRIDLERGWNPKLKKEVEAEYGITLNFAQQIGGLPVFWTMTGGTLTCQIADGSEFSTMRGRLSAWEKISDYPVLNREEIEKAMRDGFAWTDEPVECETVTVRKIRLEAYHFGDDAPKKDFPLVYFLDCLIKGGASDGDNVTIGMPALKQQRDKYGPLPSRSQGNTQKEAMPVLPVPPVSSPKP